MKSYRLTPAAEDDLFEIWIYIALENLRAADRLETDILNACEKLSDQPGLGHFRSDLTDKSVKFWLVRRNYLIVYDPESDPLEIIRVLHGARDAAAELAP